MDLTLIFVFGSNLAGRHGKGAALHARQHWGAVNGIGQGRQGQSFAIPTKDSKLRTLPLERIGLEVDNFLSYARNHPDLRFFVTPIGTGLAGYTYEQIAPMFKRSPRNLWLPVGFERIIYR